MSINLEHTADDNPAIDRNFEKLKSLVIDTGGESAGIRFGMATLTFPGGTSIFTPDTVPHGLGITPEVAFATAVHSNVFIGVASLDPTNLVFEGRTVDATIPGAGSSVNYFWLVIG